MDTPKATPEHEPTVARRLREIAEELQDLDQRIDHLTDRDTGTAIRVAIAHLQAARHARERRQFLARSPRLPLMS